jgi:hypothetical protein
MPIWAKRKIGRFLAMTAVTRAGLSVEIFNQPQASPKAGR